MVQFWFRMCGLLLSVCILLVIAMVIRATLISLTDACSQEHYSEFNFTHFKFNANEEVQLPAFYVYDDINWMSIKCLKNNLRLSVTEVLETEWRKHSDDFWFYKHALEHPARVRSPELADMFVVGGLLNLIVEQPVFSKMKCCVGSVCDSDLIQQTEDMLLNSAWFNKSGGKNHVLVASHYASCRRLESFKAISACNRVSFERNGIAKERLEIASTYVGRKCPSTDKTHDIAFIASMKHKPDFKGRMDACRWLKEAKHFNVSTCGQGHQCPALTQSHMGLHIRGDTFGSNRLMDTFLSNTVPVVTQEEQYGILPPFFPWRNMTVFAPLDSKDKFLNALVKGNVSAIQAFNTENDIVYKLDWQNKYLFEQYIHAFNHLLTLSKDFEFF